MLVLESGKTRLVVTVIDIILACTADKISMIWFNVTEIVVEER